jgi:hypothetical protein
MVLGGRTPIDDRTGARGLREAARSCGALTVSLLALAATTLASTATASAARLPPVQITYSGKMSIEVFPTEGKPSHQLRTLAWTATSNSAGSDGALALDFSTVSGSASIEGTGNCYDSTATLSLAAAKNPVATGWNLNETSDYPNPGWKYIAIGVPEVVPVLEDQTGRCSSVQIEELPQPNEMLLKQETFSPAQMKEYEAILDPFEFLPGRPATRTRTFSFDGISHCTCLPTATHVIESMTLTVSATSPAAGNNITTKAAPGGGGSSPKSTSPQRKRSESLRKALKEQAQEDLGPALEADWKAHGLAAALGLNSGLAFSTVLTELGQTGLLTDGDDATRRVINDYRIINDPPDRHFHQLARPRAPKPPALPSCAAIPSTQRAMCTSLRGAVTAMLTAGARADAITDVLLVTMNRDSGAIRAHDYSAAQRQYVHFERLHGELRSVLRARGSSGARVAAMLRGMGVSGVLSSAQSASAIGAVEAKLGRARVPTAKLGLLAKNALEARETDALESLAGASG